MHAYAGVRPLYDDGASRAKDLTREYVLDLDARAAEAPLLTVYGGKITTYRRLAEVALRRLAPYFKLGTRWTADAPLPGGDFPHDGVEALTARARGLWPFLDRAERAPSGARLRHARSIAFSATRGPRRTIWASASATI